MLAYWYRSLVLLTGELTTGFFGPIPNRTNDDMGMLNDFATNPIGLKPRSVFVIGSGFCEALTDPNTAPEGGASFLGTYFGASLRNSAYRYSSTNLDPVARYTPVLGSPMDNAGGLPGMGFGVSNGCGLENDVLQVNVVVPTAAAQALYENVGATGPYVGAIYAPSGGVRPQTTFLEGTRIGRIGNIIAHDSHGMPTLPMGTTGMRTYLLKVMALTNPSCGGQPIGVGDIPGVAGSAWSDFMSLRSPNPMRSGAARVAFGLAKSEKVEVRIYDVAGRLVKEVANRVFTAGTEHTVIWDGTSDAGERVKSGVYFYQLRTPTWTSQKKLTVLGN